VNGGYIAAASIVFGLQNLGNKLDRQLAVPKNWQDGFSGINAIADTVFRNPSKKTVTRKRSSHRIHRRKRRRILLKLICEFGEKEWSCGKGF